MFCERNTKLTKYNYNCHILTKDLGPLQHANARDFVNGAARELDVVAGSLWYQNVRLAILYVCSAPVYTWFTYFHLLAPILGQWSLKILVLSQ